MNIYLYTQNFETEDFDIFVFDSDKRVLNRMPNGPDSQTRLKWLSEHEDPNEINGEGISIAGGSGIKAYLSFKIQIDQCAPGSERTQLIFGCTDEVMNTSKLKESINSILDGIHEVLKECSFTIPSQRMHCLRKSLESKCQEISNKRTKTAVAVGLITVGVVTLAKTLMCICAKSK